jgi:hypothetical protein
MAIDHHLIRTFNNNNRNNRSVYRRVLVSEINKKKENRNRKFEYVDGCLLSDGYCPLMKDFYNISHIRSD